MNYHYTMTGYKLLPKEVFETLSAGETIKDTRGYVYKFNEHGALKKYSNLGTPFDVPGFDVDQEYVKVIPREVPATHYTLETYPRGNGYMIRQPTWDRGMFSTAIYADKHGIKLSTPNGAVTYAWADSAHLLEWLTPEGKTLPFGICSTVSGDKDQFGDPIKFRHKFINSQD